MARNMHRYRDKVIPHNASTPAAIAKSYSDPNIMKLYGTTKTNRPFFKTVYECGTFSYCVFASDDIIDKFQEKIPLQRRDFMMDATFKVVPYGKFNQLLIIYITYLERVISNCSNLPKLGNNF